MTSATASLGVPQLPAEIWRIVFSKLETTDEAIVLIWLKCRPVSRLFKEEVEHIFANILISKASMWIGKGLPNEKDDLHPRQTSSSRARLWTPPGSLFPAPAHGTAKKLTDTWFCGDKYGGTFRFDHYSENGDKAIYRCSWPSACEIDDMFKSLKDQELLRHVRKKPGNEVKIGKWLNEICLPDLTLNDREHTIALDWRQLLSRLFAEERKKVCHGGEGGAIYH